MMNNILPKEFAIPLIERPVDDSLKFWFSGKTRDGNSRIRTLSKNLNVGTISGATWTTTPLNQNCLSFDGVDDNVNFGDPSSGVLDFGTGSLSITFWLKIGVSVNNYQYPLYKGGDSVDIAGYCFYTREANADLIFAISDGDNVGTPGYNTVSSTKDIRDDRWHHFVGIRNANNSTLYLFIDGKQNATSAYTEVNINSTENLTIGKTSNSINGLIDDVRIYNRILTATEISKIYEETKYLYGF